MDEEMRGVSGGGKQQEDRGTGSFISLSEAEGLRPAGSDETPNSWTRDRLTWESSEAGDASTTRRLVTADAPLHPSAADQTALHHELGYRSGPVRLHVQ
ncbi:hypothetical protein EYF80_039381 [Liparis tanakae]|uniref:Uncharacterized protein n=1 Tax=Liparis tanakae TaxID=230148 RepID=A0A4Z2GCG6_9TELE|nr:hypothetical protein EYF80_039381 [Liparis tanakae]